MRGGDPISEAYLLRRMRFISARYYNSTSDEMRRLWLEAFRMYKECYDGITQD